MLEPCNVVKCLGHFNGIVPSLVCILDVFWRNNMASVVDIPLGNPWKWHFWDSKNFQNVPRCLSPKKLVPLVWVPKLPTIHYQPATWKLFDSPGFEPIRNGEIFWMSNNVTETRVSLRKHPFLLALHRWGCFARRNVCNSATEIPYWWRKICPKSSQKCWLVDAAVIFF